MAGELSAVALFFAPFNRACASLQGGSGRAAPRRRAPPAARGGRARARRGGVASEITDSTQVRWLAGLNHTNGLHYAPYTLPFSFPQTT